MDSSYRTYIEVTMGSIKMFKFKERQNYKILEYKIEYVYDIMIGKYIFKSDIKIQSHEWTGVVNSATLKLRSSFHQKLP